jgi:hypothetical protein
MIYFLPLNRERILVLRKNDEQKYFFLRSKKVSGEWLPTFGFILVAYCLFSPKPAPGNSDVTNPKQ